MGAGVDLIAAFFDLEIDFGVTEMAGLGDIEDTGTGFGVALGSGVGVVTIAGGVGVFVGPKSVE